MHAKAGLHAVPLGRWEQGSRHGDRDDKAVAQDDMHSKVEKNKFNRDVSSALPTTQTHPHPPTHQHPPARPSTYAHSGTVDHCMHRRLLARTILHAPSRTSTHKLHAPSPTSTQSPHRITWWTCVCLTRGHGHEVSAFVRGLIS